MWLLIDELEPADHHNPDLLDWCHVSLAVKAHRVFAHYIPIPVQAPPLLSIIVYACDSVARGMSSFFESFHEVAGLWRIVDACKSFLLKNSCGYERRSARTKHCISNPVEWTRVFLWGEKELISQYEESNQGHGPLLILDLAWPFVDNSFIVYRVMLSIWSFQKYSFVNSA